MGTGEFFCPRCNGDRTYELKGVRRWFTLFFIPIFPISGNKSVHVHCTTCQGNFAESALNLPSSGALKELHANAFRQCAAAILKAGDPTSSVARACAIATINAYAPGEDHVTDAELDDLIARADTSQLAVYASPIANRLNDRGSEQFFGKCAQIALADGPLSAEERDALRNLGESFNLSAAHQIGVIETLRAPSEASLDRPSDHD
jgi:hypothetical protein